MENTNENKHLAAYHIYLDYTDYREVLDKLSKGLQVAQNELTYSKAAYRASLEAYKYTMEVSRNRLNVLADEMNSKPWYKRLFTVSTKLELPDFPELEELRLTKAIFMENKLRIMLDQHKAKAPVQFNVSEAVENKYKSIWYCILYEELDKYEVN